MNVVVCPAASVPADAGVGPESRMSAPLPVTTTVPGVTPVAGPTPVLATVRTTVMVPPRSIGPGVTEKPVIVNAGTPKMTVEETVAAAMVVPPAQVSPLIVTEKTTGPPPTAE